MQEARRALQRRRLDRDQARRLLSLARIQAAAIVLVREALAFAPRSRKLVGTKPPPGSGTTEFSPIGSGTIAHPIQVKVGVLPRASTWNTSMDSLFPWWTAYSV